MKAWREGIGRHWAVPITVLLSPKTTRLPAVVTNDSSPHYISPGLRTFEERRKAGLESWHSRSPAGRHPSATRR